MEVHPSSSNRENEFYSKHVARKLIITWSSIGVFLLLLIIALGMIGCPAYNVYQQRMQGKAILAHAQSSREVKVAEAKAQMEASHYLAEADTTRAHGIARSNEIIGQSITPAYLHWFWIDNIDKSNNTIYIPTEANLPIFEASRALLSKQKTDTLK